MNSSGNQATTATSGGASSKPTPANSGNIGLFGGSGADDTKRRSSQEGGGAFGNLTNLKRNSQDQGTAFRKSSMSDQTKQPGAIGKMWNKYEA
ncbi:MAG: hypothetical protein M1828_000090 [Chrysothrix sp. TS-e1954]|nr:MAG: hypothetical protein M1828_000090 [Chrysothrix sp. TS-e1954]